MVRDSRKKYTGWMVGLACMLSVTVVPAIAVNAEEDAGTSYGELYEDGTWTETEAWTEEDGETVETAAPQMGTYVMAEGWSEDETLSTSETSVYKQTGMIGEAQTSTITCSYLDTNYSVMEYEQLRDMLTNNLLYSNVNAQISTSAVYTDAKDYLYIILVDDAAQDYRNTYCYVVGDYRCFCVTVQEYREEADQLTAQEQQTPREVGQSVAEQFVWN
jgi:hypothetical protein